MGVKEQPKTVKKNKIRTCAPHANILLACDLSFKYQRR